jgi:hypothetical protein
MGMSKAKENGDSGVLGLTIREQFSAMFLQGMLANPNVYQDLVMGEQVSLAVQYADALIEELRAR